MFTKKFLVIRENKICCLKIKYFTYVLFYFQIEITGALTISFSITEIILQHPRTNNTRLTGCKIHVAVLSFAVFCIDTKFCKPQLKKEFIEEIAI